MKNSGKLILIILCCSFVTGAMAQSARAKYKQPSATTIVVGDGFERTYLTQWLIAGPFPNYPVDEPMPDGHNHYGFYRDYLESLSGEEQAVFKEASIIFYSDTANTKQNAGTEFYQTDQTNIIDFEKIYGSIINSLAYAYCEIYSEKEQTIWFLMGSDDGAKVWINGQLRHSIYVGRGLKYGEDRFSAVLKKGTNRVLVKITQWVREWSFTMEMLNAHSYTEVLAEEKQKENFIKFLDVPLVLKGANTWNVFFTPGQFPELVWQQPCLVEKVLGTFPLRVTWYNSNLDEVETAEKAGRYAFIAEGTTAEGLFIRRAKTIYCMPQDWISWAERPKAYLEYLPLDSVSENAWSERKEAIADFSGRLVLLSILKQEDGAVLMSYLDEMQESGKPAGMSDTPLIRDAEYHLALKRKVLGRENIQPLLHDPLLLAEKNSSTVLHQGSEDEAGLQAGTSELLKEICLKWYEESGEPFTICIARHGVEIVNASFGLPSTEKNSAATSDIASITKLLTGVLFAQFVDQGLINIDDSVAKFLPDLPLNGPKAITLRHCFTHTSGLWSHEEWGGVNNPWLENSVSNVLKYLQVGKYYEYNGMGHNLAGKVMEIVSAKSIARLFRENFFDPLGLENTILEEDLAFSCHTNAQELAVIAQLLLNKGSYGNLRFFSEQTFEKLLPKPLTAFYPGIAGEQGIGITWMWQRHPQAGMDGLPEDKTILSENVIGHGSATSSIFQVDLENDLLITQTRRRAGKHYDNNLEKLLLALSAGLL